MGFDKWFTLRIEGELIRLARTAEPMTGDEGAVASAAVRREIESVSNRRVILIDLREAPGRNDRGFESDIRRSRTRLENSCDVCAILVNTAAGALQVKRLAENDGTGARVFMSEEKAEAYVQRVLAQ